VFQEEAARCSLEKHEAFAKELCQLLAHAPGIAATVEVVVRRCYFHQEGPVHSDPEPGSGSACSEQRHATTAVSAAVPEVPCGDPTQQAGSSTAQAAPQSETSTNGFCLTAYVTGFGDEEHEPGGRWEIALALLQNALVQVSRR